MASTSRATPLEITWLHLVALAGTLIVMGFVGSRLAWGQLPVLPPLCLFKAMTGWPCGTCGTTRAFQALARGDVITALRFQPLLMTLYLGALVVTLIDGAAWWGRRRQWLPILLRKVSLSPWIFVGLFLFNWFYLILFIE